MDKNKLSAKYIPSTPIWTNTIVDFGYFSANYFQLYELASIYQHNSVVHSCIDINAKGIVSAQPSLFRLVNKGAKNLSSRGLKPLTKSRARHLNAQWTCKELNRPQIDDDLELVDAKDTPFYEVLDSSDNNQNLHQLIRLTVINLCVFGICFWNKVRDGSGEVTSYLYLPAYAIEPNRRANGEVIGWFYTSTFGGGQTYKQSILPDDMLIFRWPSISDPMASGDSPLMSALTKIELSGKWTDWQNWLLNNRARPDAMFIPRLPDNVSLNEEQIERAEKGWNDKFRGEGNGRVKISEYPGQVVPLNWSPVDLAPLKFDEELRKAILFALNIPESFTNNDGNRANLEGSLEQWARQSLAPIASLIEHTLTKEAQTFDENLIFAFENVIPEDAEFQLEIDQFDLNKWQIGLTSGAITPDDYRTQILGLDPLPQAEILDKDKDKDKEPEVEVDSEEEEAKEEGEKAFDLLALNKEVHLGTIDRAVAINIVAYKLAISQEEAKNLVAHKGKKRKRKQEVTKAPEDKLSDALPALVTQGGDVTGTADVPDVSDVKDLTDATPEDATPTEERRICLEDASSCECCKYEADKGWVAIGELKAIGDCQCSDNCRCTFEYR